MQELVSSETLNNEEEIIIFEENLKGPKGDKGDDGYTPVKGTDYFTEADKQELIEAVIEDSGSEFVQIVNSKTTEFNNNATSKTESFNSNATSKETSYNENATSKLNEYNENHTSKLNAYNENSAEKTADYNENAAEKIAEYDEHIEELDNIVSKNTANGESIYIDDALKYKIFDCKIDGNAEQTTTTGKQMLQMCAEVREANGLTFTKNIDGSVIIDGTSNATTYCNINTSYTDDNDKKYFSLKQNSYYTVYLKNRTNDVNLAIRTSTINSAIVQLESSEINSGQYTNEDSQTGFAYLQVAANKTFHNLVVYPMISEGQYETLKWEEYTNGEVSPNPDYPQEIETLSFKNVLNIPDQVITNSGCTFTFENGICTIAGTATADEIYCVIENLNLILKAGTYTYSSGLNYPYPYFSIYYNGSFKQISVYDDNGVKTFEIDEDIIVTQVRFYFSKGSMSNIQKFTPQIEKGSTATEFVKYENIGILQVGKNLFDNVNYGHLGFWNYNVGQITTMSSNDLYLSAFCQVTAGKTYTISREILSNRFAIAACNEVPNINTTALVLAASSNAKSLTVTVPDNYSYLVLYLQNDGTYEDVLLQVEEGSVATDYEEYKSNEYDIDLQDNELVKITDDIKDTIEIDKSGNVNLNKKIGKIFLDGTENIILDGELSNVYRFICYNVNSLLNYENAAISNYLINERNYTSDKEHFYISTNNAFLFMKKDLFSSKDNALVELKQMLSTNNMIIYSDLIEPTTTSLGQLANFKTYAGINHFFLETNLATNFEIKYVQDLQKVISKQQEEINELKTLLSSTATSALLLDNYESDLINEIESEVEQ